LRGRSIHPDLEPKRLARRRNFCHIYRHPNSSQFSESLHGFQTGCTKANRKLFQLPPMRGTRRQLEAIASSLAPFAVLPNEH
jgi:hypothetical protein